MSDDFRDMIGLLKKHGVEFLLIGGHAMAAYSLPRATGDIDFWVRPTPDNARRVWQALVEFGAPLHSAMEEDFAVLGRGLHIGVPPFRIDILTAIDGVTFDEAWPNRAAVTLLDHEVYVIGRRELIRNKRATGRDQDREDARRLESASS